MTGEGGSAQIKNRTLVLTEESFIEMKMCEPVKPPPLPQPTSAAIVMPQRIKKHKSLLEIHSIEVDEPTLSPDQLPYPYSFRIHFFSGSASSKAKAGYSKLKRLLAIESSFEDFLKTKIVRCHSREERDQWVLVLEKVVRNLWQKTLEKSIVPAPEICKRHAFVIKQHNDRLLIISDYWLYNVDVTYKPVEIKVKEQEQEEKEAESTLRCRIVLFRLFLMSMQFSMFFYFFLFLFIYCFFLGNQMVHPHLFSPLSHHMGAQTQ